MIRILKYGEVANSEIFARAEATVDVASIVSGIIENVRANGDKALLEYSEKFDKVQLSSVEVTAQEIDEAFASVDEEFLEVIRKAAVNIHNFHKRQVRNSFLIEGEDGIVMGQRITPIDRVGLYVPGGTAAYPSSVLMNSIPAKIAGCGMIVMVTPPGKDGKVNPNILAAAKIAGVDRIFKVGVYANNVEPIKILLKLFATYCSGVFTLLDFRPRLPVCTVSTCSVDNEKSGVTFVLSITSFSLANALTAITIKHK